MALTFSQAPVPGTTAVSLLTVPPGQYSLSFYTSAATTIYLGTSNGVSATNGYPCTSVPTFIESFTGSKGGTVWALNTASTTLSVNYVLSTNH